MKLYKKLNSLKDKIDEINSQIQEKQNELARSMKQMEEFREDFCKNSKFEVDIIFPFIVDILSIFSGLEKYVYLCDGKESINVTDLHGKVVMSVPFYYGNTNFVQFYYDGFLNDNMAIRENFYIDTCLSFLARDAVIEFIECVIFANMSRDIYEKSLIDILNEEKKKILLQKKKELEELFNEKENFELAEFNNRLNLRKDFLATLNK